MGGPDASGHLGARAARLPPRGKGAARRRRASLLPLGCPPARRARLQPAAEQLSRSRTRPEAAPAGPAAHPAASTRARERAALMGGAGGGRGAGCSEGTLPTGTQTGSQRSEFCDPRNAAPRSLAPAFGTQAARPCHAQLAPGPRMERVPRLEPLCELEAGCVASEACAAGGVPARLPPAGRCSASSQGSCQQSGRLHCQWQPQPASLAS